MAIYSGPEIPNSGLIFNLDAANPKNFGLNSVQVLVVGGGGSGGVDNGAGGGAGGLIYNSNFSVTPGTALTVTVGAGGAARLGTSDDGPGNNGGNSVFGSLTAIGGSGGTGWVNAALPPGSATYSGGSGAGQSASTSALNSVGVGTATSGQGFAGGAAVAAFSGGGGGAGGPGGAAISSGGTTGKAGDGGRGYYSNISGTLQCYAAGGAGGWDVINGYTSTSVPFTENGTVKKTTQTAEDPCPANTGHGGNGANHNNQTSGAGGSGVVIVRYAGPQRAIGGTVTRVGNDTVHTFTSVGSTTFTPLSTSSLIGLSDLSSNGKIATTVNSPTYNASNGGRAVLNGTNNYMTSPMINLRPTSGITQEVWFNLASTSGDHVFIGSQYGTSSGNSYALWGNGNQWFGGVNTTGTFAYLTANLTKSASTWYHFVYTYNGSTEKMYVNSQEVATGSRSGSIVYNTNNTLLALGGDWNGSGYDSGIGTFVNGSISIIRIYNMGLSATEVKSLFEASRDRYGV